MKKTILTIAIVLGLGISSFADENKGGGMFYRGVQPRENSSLYGNRDANNPLLPNLHGNMYDANAQDGNSTPLGGGIAVLIGLGGAYLVGKRRKEK